MSSGGRAMGGGSGELLYREVEEEIYAKTMHPQDDFDLQDYVDGCDSPASASGDGSGDGSGPRRTSSHAPPEVAWFHGKISREDANRIISGYVVGAYLVRESLVDVGNFSIALRVSAGVRHFKIYKHELGDFYIADNCFPSLAEVVSFFSVETLCEDTCLINPVGPAAPVSVPPFKNLAIALYDYTAMSSEELTFKTGDRLDIINDSDKHWLWVRLQSDLSRSGFVPRNHVEELTDLSEREAAAECQLPSAFHRSQWIHGKVERKDADAMLKSAGRSGSFFVRESVSLAGNYALSFRGPNKIQHFPIAVTAHKKYECGGRQFDCLEAIVLRYYKDALMDDTRLQFPIPPKAKYTDQFDVDGAIYGTVESAKATASAAPPKPVPLYERRRLSAVATSVSDGKGSLAMAAAAANATARTSPSSSSKHAVSGGYLGGGGGGDDDDTAGYTMMGTLVKKGKRGKKWKPMYFGLMGRKKRLYYFDNQHAIKPKGIIDLDTATIELADDSLFGRPHCFALVVQHPHCIYLCCDTEEDRTNWLTALSPCCSQCGFAPLQPDPAVQCSVASVELSVMEAKKFGVKEGKFAYGLVSFGGINHARTPKVAVKKESAFFGEEFTFGNIGVEVTGFKVDFYSRGNFAVKDKRLAGVPVAFAGLKENETNDGWHEMQDDGGNPCGSARLKITLVKDVLLPTAEYKDLQDILCSAGVTAPLVISELHQSTTLNDYARDLNTVWRATGTTVPMLDGLNQELVAAESRPETLFRGNSLASKAMDQYMKMTAIPFLHAAIREPVRLLFEDKRSCELDGTRAGGKPENLKVLLEHTTAIVDGLSKSLSLCPPPLREVFQKLQAAVSKKWPKDRAVKYTAVSAFLFLRLVCPAVMNPKLFNMMPDHPSDVTARNLTLVAKLLQNLVNMTEFGQKESYLIVCNSWIMAHRGKMQKFIDAAATTTLSSTPLPQVADTRRALASIVRGCSQHADTLAQVVAGKDKESKVVGGRLLAIVAKIDAKVALAR